MGVCQLCRTKSITGGIIFCVLLILRRTKETASNIGVIDIKDRIDIIVEMGMTVFFIGSYKEPPTTGGHIYNKKIVEALQEMECNVIVINVHQLPKIFRNKFLSFIYCFCRFLKCKPRLIIQVADSGLRYFIFTFFISLWHIPTIQMVHHFEEDFFKDKLKSKLSYHIIKQNLQRAKLIIVNSQNTKNKVMKRAGDNYQSKIHIVNPGVDIIPEIKRERFYDKKEYWNLLSVGAVTERKGYDYLIEALRDLKDYPFKCYIVGNIDDKQFYEHLKIKIEEYGLSKKIEFTGYIPNERLQKLYLSCDIFILPSRHEGYGIVLKEALNYGLPVIATNVGAVSEVVENGKTGILVEPNNPGSLAETLQNLMHKPIILAQIAENIQKRNLRIKTWSAVRQELKTVFKISLNKNGIAQN